MAEFDMSNTHGMQAHCLFCDTPTVEMVMRMRSVGDQKPEVVWDEDLGLGVEVGMVIFEQEVHCKRCQRELTDDQIIWRTPDGTGAK